MTSTRSLLIIRHAVAESRDAFAELGQDDALRPLTAAGREKMKQTAIGIRALVPTIDVLAASPLVRAQQTADIVASRYEGLTRVTTESLEPERHPAALAAWLRRQPPGTVAVVGHEPHLGLVITWLMSGLMESRVRMRKGGACLLEISGRPAAGTATLQWILTPAQLIRLGK
jgi:phosphohistidine phosphatase